ncbi:universal stress protein [Pseudonocardia acaciae]|uniref:universal stress protein n=1 Tax=Pseudonocardia acaciae TaxID=551276 RepID=UPI000491734E|nr:universal stress protein [Pseudonocardia acaciae]
MTLVVGLPREGRAKSVLQLAALLARSTGDDLVICSVVPAPWPPGFARVDAEYQADVERGAREALDAALGTARLPATTVVSKARSTPAGLLEVAERHGASMLVLGSSPAGPLGRVSLGGVAERVLHSSPIPVALAPRGFRCRPDGVLTRVTAAYGPGEGSEELVASAARTAARAGAGLRVASFAVRPGTMLTAGVGGRAEAAVVAEWTEDIERAQHAVLDRIAALPSPPRTRETAIGHGRDWYEAVADIGWADGDILLVGSSSDGPLARVFLGSRASKIVRNAPVPVIAAPRAR